MRDSHLCSRFLYFGALFVVGEILSSKHKGSVCAGLKPMIESQLMEFGFRRKVVSYNWPPRMCDLLMQSGLFYQCALRCLIG